jgi:hypothetical protein
MLVSILIPCYNAERWIAQCIESALAQTWPDKEIIVVDDGSTDSSLAIIKGFGSRIRWETGPNRGGNAARNRLLELARGEWLQYLDADDYLLLEKITDQVACLEAYPNADILYSQVLIEMPQPDGAPGSLESSPLPEPHDPWIHLARWRLPQTGGSLWRKKAVVAAGGWDESMSCCQEHELYLRLLSNGAVFVHCPDGGAVYRTWSEGTVSRREPLKVAQTRLQVLGRLQDTLAKRGNLGAARLHAINLTRFETARKLWGTEQNVAEQIMKTVQETEPAFRPEGAAGGILYRIAYAVAGFAVAEQVASLVRGARRNARRT